MGEDARARYIQADSKGSIAMTKVEICKKKFEVPTKIYIEHGLAETQQQ